MNDVRIGCKAKGGVTLMVFTGKDNALPKLRRLAGPPEIPFKEFGVTRIDKEFWDAWVEQNKQGYLLRSFTVFSLDR